jgi:hypothetical protein
VLIDPPEREQEDLPELAAELEVERQPIKNFDQPLRMPNLGIVLQVRGFQGDLWLISKVCAASYVSVGN